MATHVQGFTPEIIELFRVHLPTEEAVRTLVLKRPNWIAGIDPGGVLVKTERTRSTESGPQVVPAWMMTRGSASCRAAV